MKLRFLVTLVLGFCLFGMGSVHAAMTPKQNDALNTYAAEHVADGKQVDVKENSNWTITVSGGDNGTQTYDANGNSVSSQSNAGTDHCIWAWRDDFSCASFQLDPGNFSPSERIYKWGTSGNITDLIGRIARYLLIAISTVAVLAITIGGLMMATAGGGDRAAKGKTIVLLNVTALLFALFSYSIIYLVRWLISA